MSNTPSPAPSPSLRHGGRILVDQLAINGVTRVFHVPGESFLAVLDGLYESEVEAVGARQEGGAAMMAEADGKLTGRPGVAFVTRGPGATNASAGVHVARQDSTPMILFIGQVATDQKDREAFQEVDYGPMFAPLAKAVFEIGRTDRIPEYVARAFSIAMNGRPGPVVVALPEDVLSAEARVADAAPVSQARRSVNADDIAEILARMRAARAPLVVAGGAGWSRDGCRALAKACARQGWPVASSFRAQDVIDNRAPNYCGDLGIGASPALLKRLDAADLVLALGPRLGEMTTGGYTRLSVPDPDCALIHVHVDPDEIGRVYTPSLGLAARPDAVAKALADAPPMEFGHDARDEAVTAARAEQEAWTRPQETQGAVKLERIVAHLAKVLPRDAILTNGAGNYAGLLHRHYPYGPRGTQLAPTSGSMGYGLPAAIAAALREPDREVVCFAGDGCFQMTCQEFGVACEHGLKVIVIVVDNGVYGTIRMHQQRAYPGRPVGTALANPDFAAWARSYGAAAFTVERTEAFADAFAGARRADGPALIHLKTDPAAVTTRG